MNSESVDLIYLDPPFNSKRTYSAPVGNKAAGASFKDMWAWQDVDEGCLEPLFGRYPVMVQFIATIGTIHAKAMMSYITYMSRRIVEMRCVLKPTGSIYLHCDPTASHYLKIVMDRIFGKKSFRNKIIWRYGGGGSIKEKLGQEAWRRAAATTTRISSCFAAIAIGLREIAPTSTCAPRSRSGNGC